MKNIQRDLEKLELLQEQLDSKRNATIINFFNEEYDAGFSEDRSFERFEDLFSEEDGEEGYLDPYDLRLGWDELRLFLYWQAAHDYALRMGLTEEVLEMMASDDERRRSHGKNGVTVADYGIGKALSELDQVTEVVKAAKDRLIELQQLLDKYK